MQYLLWGRKACSTADGKSLSGCLSVAAGQATAQQKDAAPVTRKKTSPTITATVRDAKRMTGGAPTTPQENQASASRRSQLKDVAPDIRKQGRRETTQNKAEARANKP